MNRDPIDAKIDEIATTVATKYARTCWWADLEDLKQEAWLVLLEFKARWAPRTPEGHPDPVAFGPLGYRAVSNQLSRYLWRLSSPVRLSDHACNAATAGWRLRAPDDAVQARPGSQDPERALAERQAVLRTQHRALALLGGVPDPWTRAVMTVLLEGERLRTVAATHGLPHAELHRRVAAARKAGVHRDRKLAALAGRPTGDD